MSCEHNRERSDILALEEVRTINNFSNLHLHGSDATNESDLFFRWFAAASSGNTDVIKALIDKHLEVKDNNKSTALHVCAFHGYEEAVRILLDRGASVKAKNQTSNTALHYAVGNGHTEVVRLLLDKQDNVNAKNDNGNTALHCAAGKGLIEVVHLLINKSAAVNEKNANLETALHIAAKIGHIEVVRQLLDNSATIDDKDQNNKTALHYAAGRGHTEVVRLLLKHGIISAKDQDLYTALCLATDSGNKEVIHLLLEQGGITYPKEGEPRTALLEAAKKESNGVAELLLDIFTPPDSKDEQSRTDFRKAVEYGDCELVSQLLTTGAKASENSKDEKPLLVELSEMGDIRMVTFLLEKKIEKDAPDKNGQTALIVAAKAAQSDIVSLLLEKEADITASDNDLFTALHWSAREGHLSVLEKLLGNHAEIDAKTKHGNTALHLAAESHHSDIVATLINHRAELNVENDDNCTPIQVAILNGHVDIVDLFMDKGAKIGTTSNRNLSLLYQAADAGQIAVVQRALRRIADKKERLSCMNAVLHRTAQYGQSKVVTHLLENGAEIDATDDDGWSPLFLAGQHSEVLCILIHYGARITVRNIKKKYQSILHHFASHKHIDALFISLSCGGDIHVTDDNYETALHYAAKTNDLEVVDVLIRRGVDINAMNVRGETALHIAIENDCFHVAKLLLERGIDIEAKTLSSELTALHIAFEDQNYELISLLLERGANVNATKSWGETALHIAAENSLNVECDLLIEYGAKIDPIANSGKTPLRHAIDKLNPYLVKQLLTHGASVQRMGHIGNPIQYAISAVNNGNDYAYDSGFIPVIKLLMDAGASTDNIQLPINLKWRYPTLENTLNSYFSLPNALFPNERAENQSSEPAVDYMWHGEEELGKPVNERHWLHNTRHKYGRGFPFSKYLQLDDFPDIDAVDSHAISAERLELAQSLQLTNAKRIDELATELIQSLLDVCFVNFSEFDDFFLLEVEGRAVEMQKWASDFDKMNGIIREPGRLIVQIPSRITTLSVPEWHKHDNPYLRFIDAVYVCRRSSLHHDQEAFSDIIGGSEHALAKDLHSILIAGLSILSVFGHRGRVEELVMAILGTTQYQLDRIKLTEWQVVNRRLCPCKSESIHRPLSPVAAAKSVGIKIWRRQQEPVVINRVWDLQKDELVDKDGGRKINVREVVFITHSWSKAETTYLDVIEKRKLNGQAVNVSEMSDKLGRIRKSLLGHTKYVWIDTICIDKSNLSELDEAIRSMYKWYSNCAAVVLDPGTSLKKWRTRGWCLQEGAAAGFLCGIKEEGILATIQELALEQNQDLCTLDLHLYYRLGNAAEILGRMDVRETAREEDMAYALAGLFSIHLTLAYGEGIKSRERLLYELATQRGDLSFLSFQSTLKTSQNCLPAISQPNYLMAECTEASTPVLVSHFGIRLEVQLEKGPGARLILQKLNSWKDLRFAKGRSSGVKRLIEMTKAQEKKKSATVKLAIVHCIRSILLVESYDSDLYIGSGRRTDCYRRLQCCQIEEMEFTRLFAEDRDNSVKIWLCDKPDGIETSLVATSERSLPHQSKREKQSSPIKNYDRQFYRPFNPYL